MAAFIHSAFYPWSVVLSNFGLATCFALIKSIFARNGARTSFKGICVFLLAVFVLCHQHKKALPGLSCCRMRHMPELPQLFQPRLYYDNSTACQSPEMQMTPTKTSRAIQLICSLRKTDGQVQSRYADSSPGQLIPTDNELNSCLFMLDSEVLGLFFIQCNCSSGYTFI